MNVNRKNSLFRGRESSEDRRAKIKKDKEFAMLKESKHKKGKNVESYDWLFKLRRKYVEDLGKVADDEAIIFEYKEKIKQISL